MNPLEYRRALIYSIFLSRLVSFLSQTGHNVRLRVIEPMGESPLGRHWSSIRDFRLEVSSFVDRRSDYMNSDHPCHIDCLGALGSSQSHSRVLYIYSTMISSRWLHINLEYPPLTPPCSSGISNLCMAVRKGRFQNAGKTRCTADGTAGTLFAIETCMARALDNFSNNFPRPEDLSSTAT